MKRKYFFLLLVGSILLAGCSDQKKTGHGHSHMVEEGEDHETHGNKSVSKTIYQDSIELFVDFPPLSEGEVTDFRVHLTELDGYVPLSKGQMEAQLIKGQDGIRSTVDSFAQPGIIIPSLKPVSTGQHQLVFVFSHNGQQVRFEAGEVTVYANDDEARGTGHDGDVVSFTKEQQWNTEFRVAELQPGPFAEVIHTSAELQLPKDQQRMVTSPANGEINNLHAQLVQGKSIQAGDPLLTIQGVGVSKENLSVRYEEAKARFEQAKAAYERGQDLVDDQIISQSELEKRKVAYEQAKSAFDAVSDQYSNGGRIIKAAQSGSVAQVMVEEGDYVEQGEPLVKLHTNGRLLLRAEVARNKYSRLSDIRTAHFQHSGSDRLYKTRELDGELISYGKSTDAQRPYVPVIFAIDNQGELLPGSYVETYLIGKQRENVITVPESALVEEEGNYFVFVQHGGESFEKKQVALGATDGNRYEVLAGLEAGNRIVTKGGYSVKLAAASGAMPSHGH